jgi:hypothetical protein
MTPFEVPNFSRTPKNLKRISFVAFYDVKARRCNLQRVHIRDTAEFSDLIAAALGKPVQQSYSLVRLNFAGEPPNAAIHADSGYDEIAAVLYMAKPEDCAGGTAFWKHKKTGFDHWPTEQEIRKLGKSPSRTYATIEADWDNADAWEQLHVSKMEFGKAIFYPTKFFHSRWPFEAFGNGPEDGRLIWVSFMSPVC